METAMMRNEKRHFNPTDIIVRLVQLEEDRRAGRDVEREYGWLLQDAREQLGGAMGRAR